MKLILKSKGRDYVCIYDDKDHNLISRYNWNYHRGYVKSGNILMHRLILGLIDPSIYADHIDHNGLNNCRANLRACNKSQNQWNRQSQGGSSRFKGVTRYQGRFFAQIRCNNQYHYIGLYRSEITAGKAYDRKAREFHKEYANVNFKDVTAEPKQLTFFELNEQAK